MAAQDSSRCPIHACSTCRIFGRCERLGADCFGKVYPSAERFRRSVSSLVRALSFRGPCDCTSTSSRMVITKRSDSEFRHPTITPGVVDLFRFFGQNIRTRSLLPVTIFPCCQASERASSAKLLPCRYTMRQRSGVKARLVRCKALNRDGKGHEDQGEDGKPFR